MTVHSKFPRLIAGAVLRLLAAAALWKVMTGLTPFIVTWPWPAVAALYAALLLPMGLLTFTGLWHVLGLCLNLLPQDPPAVVIHVTDKTASKAIEASGVIMRGSHLLTNLGSGVYVREGTPNGQMTAYARFAQSFSWNHKAPFLHFYDPADLVAIPIRVRHPERLVVNALVPTRTWVVWGDITRVGDEFEI